MNKHDNIYNILGKLASLEPAPAKPQSVLKELNESANVAPTVAQRLNEKYMGFKKTVAAIEKGGSAEDPEAVAAAIGRKKYGKEKFQKAAAAGKKLGESAPSTHEDPLVVVYDKDGIHTHANLSTVNRIFNIDVDAEDVHAGPVVLRSGWEDRRKIKIELSQHHAKDKMDEQVSNEDMLAKKDYDNDGKRETGKQEYMGSRDKAIKKAMGKTKEEGNEFSGELAKARAQGKDSFEVDGKSYSVKESDGDVVPGKSWIKDPSDPDSKIPAYRRKETEPGRQAAQAAADAANAKVGAKVFRPAKSARPSDVEEDQYNEDDAHSSLPGIRKTTKEEHSEYDAAAHTVRKWMRKRGWNTHEEFKPALKYIMDNLEDTHDDSLTDQVKEAAKICEKHHMAVAEAGLKNEASNDSEGPADLLAAVEQEIARPGRSTDNLRDVLNATFGSDRSPEFKKARAVIGKYLDLVDNADVGSEQDGIAPMRDGNIARHIQQYDLTDYLQHAAAMLDKKGPMSEASTDQEGPADLLAAIEQEINNPGRTVDNLRDVLNATFGSDRSPEFKKARAVIGKYLDLLDNAAIGSEQDGISPMRDGNIARHIQQYDLTDYLQHAAAMLDKKGPMSEAGLDMNLLKGAQGAMRGANTDPESERNRGKPYGYRTDRDDTGNDDDYDEHGNEKKGVKKSAPSDGPKKKGRPRKNFGPERTTAKAYKHKGKRVSESINLETYVEDVMEELETMFIIEKAKSKAQQKFMGMVYAAKKGEKPASKEVAKAAKGMSKKDAEDFAKTKHKGLPDKVTEGVNFAEMVKETGQTVEEMLMELNMEMEEFKRSGRMGDKLRDALDLHRHSRGLMGEGDIDPNRHPQTKDYGRGSDDDFFHNPDVPDDEQLPRLPKEVNLDELALLAGLHGGQKKLDKNKDGKLTAMDFELLRGDKKGVDESSCNMTPEGQYCEVHGMGECGMMEGAMDTIKGLAKTAGDKVMRHADVTGYTKAKQNFTKWIDSHQELASHKENLLAKFDAEAEQDPHTPWDWGKEALAQWKNEQRTMAESKGSKPDFNDVDNDGDETESWKKAEDDRENADSLKEDLQADDGQHYANADDFFSTIEGDWLDREEESEDGMEVRGYIDGVNVMVFRYDDESKTSGYGVYNDDELMNECGMPGGMGGEATSGMNINTSMDTKTGRKTVTVTADGDAADELARILKMAGMIGAVKQDQGLDEYANEPDEKYATTDAILRQGNDLNRPKSQYADKAKLGDNPMATVESKLNELYQAMKQRK